MARAGEITIENARIGFRNFSGKPSQYNKDGNREFAVFLDEDMANELERDGWNVKRTKGSVEYEREPEAYITVAVRFDNFPPRVVMINGNNKNRLTEDTVGELDHSTFESIDLIISPSHWEMNGRKGIKAYLRVGYFTLERDPFFDKYYGDEFDEADLPF